jgi:hypothetical protein
MGLVIMSFKTEKRWLELEKTIREEAISSFRFALSKELTVGPFNDGGIAIPGKEKGDGFAIFIGEWRIGWWETRSEACDAADRISGAIKQHPVIA